MKYINKNRIYRCDNRDLKIKHPGSHDVIIVWKNPYINLCRVKTITSLEHGSKNNIRYDFKALNQAKHGVITPYPFNILNTCHWSGVYNNSKIVQISKLKKTYTGVKVPKQKKRALR